MAKKLTNEHSIDLPMAVWLLQDGYRSGADVAPEGELISVTSLMKPVRQQILQRKVDQSAEAMDLSALIASRMGHALHDSIERSWIQGDYGACMRRMGYPQDVIDSIRVNPDTATVKKGEIPIYIEQRGFKEFEGVILTGQLDFSINGSYRDTKSTSTFSYTSGNKDEDYIIQGSLYRWIMPNLITKDVMRIEFIFTDWASYRAKSSKDYPQCRISHKDFPLMSLKDTEAWAKNRIDEIKANAKLPQSEMVRCSDKELWRDKDTYKYYAKPETAKAGGRCTKRFDNVKEAFAHKDAKMKGVVVTDPGQVKACLYCPAFSICEQRKEYFSDNGESIQ